MKSAVTQEYVAPGVDLDGFNCPHCGVHSHQTWHPLEYRSGEYAHAGAAGLVLAVCARCRQFSVWHSGTIIFPAGVVAPVPHPDLFTGARSDYQEARSICEASPRAAAALLRLTIQKMCRHFGGSGRDIAADIEELVQRGLPVGVQQALALVRVIGDNAVDPGRIDARDNAQTAAALFRLINLIAEKLIAEPKEIGALLEGLPQPRGEPAAR